jgi:hypothetical protein
MTKNSGFWAGIFLAAILGGCGVSSDTVRLDSVERTATSPNQVQRLTAPPSQPYKIVARIQVGPDALVSDYEGQIQELVRLASQLGADGVILEHGSRTSGYMVDGVGYVGESKFTVGQAFVWLND